MKESELKKLKIKWKSNKAFLLIEKRGNKMENKKRNVKAHKRYDPRINKKVDVGSYDRNQRFNPYKKLSNSKKPSQLKCFYCGDNVSMGELIQSDQTLGDMEGEDREFLIDSFPKTKNPRKAPFVHKSDLGYDVLNICKKHIRDDF